MTAAEITRRLLAHYRRHRRDLPWRVTRPDPYAIWVCEIMAQQTQIGRVIDYWTRWMTRFPTVLELARAPLASVLALWSGLGYYSRARSLHRAAQIVVAEHGARLPRSAEALATQPGIGPYTAGGIASIAFGERVPAVDGNVTRVIARLHALEGEVHAGSGGARVRELAATLVPARAPGDLNQALFDLGATICTPRAPACERCPLRPACAAHASGRQHVLPRPKVAARVKLVSVDCAAVRRGRRILLGRRQPNGLYGGLWELPELEALPATSRVDTSRVLAEHVHELSHRTRHHRVFAATLRGTARVRLALPYDQARFVARDDLSGLGISSATRLLLAHLNPEPEMEPHG
jgi:A/G-specific adenine glycosylase